MTIKPSAQKFRIRRPGDGAGPAAGAAPPRAPDPPAPAQAPAEMPAARQPDFAPGPRRDDGFGDAPFPTAAAAAPRQEPPRPDAPRAEALPPAAPRAEAPRPPAAADGPAPEEMTARQLRIARRLALRHGLKPRSDAEAVHMLRRLGIDPLERRHLLALVAPEQVQARAPGLPQTVPQPQLPAAPKAPQKAPAPDPAREIAEIQRDIARRRRRRMWALVLRLVAFVLLPTLVAGYYFHAVATPMFATKSEFVIQQADGAPQGGLGGMLGAAGLGGNQDSITVQSYLQSRESMLRLEADIGYRAHFSTPAIDPIQRLDPDATMEETYRHYTRHVKIGFDPTEGIVKMEVIAPDPEVSAAFSRALITYAEEQVDNLSLRLREDQMSGATDSFREAETKMEAAQARVLALQEQLGVLDPQSESASVMGQIGAFETQLAERRLQLQQLLDNPVPNAARVAGAQGDIARLETLIAELRAPLTAASGGTASLARISAELRMAQVDLETRTQMMQESLQLLESARIEANRQVRYLSTGVNPIPPDEATYPRAFENTLLAFLVFSGIYLMLSLTASILREQVSG
jgi:capsular polysaccharide transport system permease protein